MFCVNEGLLILKGSDYGVLYLKESCFFYFVQKLVHFSKRFLETLVDGQSPKTWFFPKIF
jgi:hypothetical protein